MWILFPSQNLLGLFARLLEILSGETRTSQEMFDEFPKTVNTPELKLYIDEDKKYGFMDRLVKEAKFPGGNVITIDGIRVEFPYGWGLVRPSNTTPCLTLRFEADSEKDLEKVFIETPEFKDILTGRYNLVIGNKGSGKNIT